MRGCCDVPVHGIKYTAIGSQSRHYNEGCSVGSVSQFLSRPSSREAKVAGNSYLCACTKALRGRSAVSALLCGSCGDRLLCILSRERPRYFTVLRQWVPELPTGEIRQGSNCRVARLFREAPDQETQASSALSRQSIHTARPTGTVHLAG